MLLLHAVKTSFVGVWNLQSFGSENIQDWLFANCTIRMATQKCG